jgi:hypothetical protein
MKPVIDMLVLASLPTVSGIALVSTVAVFGGHPYVAIFGYCIGSILTARLIKRPAVAYDPIQKR